LWSIQVWWQTGQVSRWSRAGSGSAEGPFGSGFPLSTGSSGRRAVRWVGIAMTPGQWIPTASLLPPWAKSPSSRDWASVSTGAYQARRLFVPASSASFRVFPPPARGSVSPIEHDRLTMAVEYAYLACMPRMRKARSVA
jgi:hypothetical protein